MSGNEWEGVGRGGGGVEGNEVSKGERGGWYGCVGVDACVGVGRMAVRLCLLACMCVCVCEIQRT